MSKVQSSEGQSRASATQAETRPVVERVRQTHDDAVGSRVITSFGNIGTVEKMDKEVAEVLVGGMRLREKIANLQLAEQAETRAVASVPGQSIADVSNRSTPQMPPPNST